MSPALKPDMFLPDISDVCTTVQQRELHSGADKHSETLNPT